eukprot:gene2647-2114_t
MVQAIFDKHRLDLYVFATFLNITSRDRLKQQSRLESWERTEEPCSTAQPGTVSEEAAAPSTLLCRAAGGPAEQARAAFAADLK